MAYTPTTWATGDTVTATKMNKLEQGVANAGGGEYDLIIECPLNTSDTSLVSIIKGDILDCEDKIDNGEIVNAVCISTADWNSAPSTANSTKYRYFLPLTMWNCPYAIISFTAAVCPLRTSNAKEIHRVTIHYDTSDGSITDAISQAFSL